MFKKLQSVVKLFFCSGTKIHTSPDFVCLNDVWPPVLCCAVHPKHSEVNFHSQPFQLSSHFSHSFCLYTCVETSVCISVHRGLNHTRLKTQGKWTLTKFITWVSKCKMQQLLHFIWLTWPQAVIFHAVPYSQLQVRFFTFLCAATLWCLIGLMPFGPHGIHH